MADDVSTHSLQAAASTNKFQHLSEMAEFLNSLRTSDSMCDVTINLQDQEYRAHKVVLSSASGYFRSMFTSGYRENKMDKISMAETPDLNTGSFKTLLEFMYTGDLLHLSLDSVPQLLAGASYLQINHAIKACVEFIKLAYNEEKLTLESLIKLSAMSSNHGIEDLQETTRTFLAKHFGEICNETAFLTHTTYQNLADLLDRADLVVTSETEVLKGMISWLKQDWASRNTHTLSLLGKIRLGLVPIVDIIECFEGPLNAVPDCRDIYVDLLKYYALGKKAFVSNLLADKQHDIFTPRDYVKGLVTIRSLSCKMFDEDNNIMREIKGKLNVCGERFAVIVVNGEPYLHGLDFRKYDSKDEQWINLPTMKIRHRKYCPIIHFQGYIYAIGGVGYKGVTLNGVERFDITKRQWQMVAPLPCPLDGRHASVTIYNDRIIVSGFSSDTVSHYVMMFDPSANIWHTLYSQLSGDEHHKLHVHVIDDILYLIAFKNVSSKYGKPSPAWQWCPTVYRCKCDVGSEQRQPSFTTEELVDQKFIPETAMKLFRVGNDVFVSFSGYAYKTRVNIADDQVYDVDMSSYSALGVTNLQDAIVLNVQRKYIKPL